MRRKRPVVYYRNSKIGEVVVIQDPLDYTINPMKWECILRVRLWLALWEEIHKELRIDEYDIMY